MKALSLLSLLSLLLILIACDSSTSSTNTDRFLGQGLLVGEITDEGALLQTRLTASDSLVAGELQGMGGVVRFTVGETPELQGAPLLLSPWLAARSIHDFTVRYELTGLKPDQRYYYLAEYGPNESETQRSRVGTFRTNAGATKRAPFSFAVVTGMNYYHFHSGNYNAATRYQGPDKALGYPALETIARFSPDYFIATGDNVYFDHPAEKGFLRAQEQGKNPLPGLFGGKEVTDEAGMRRKYHVQFVQPRFRDLFLQVGTYWEKDDHDYRINDSDPYTDFPISHKLGVKNFREQLPVVRQGDETSPTYRTHRLSRDAQIWLLEGRDYRSANEMEDGPQKTIWGETQKAWLKETLLASDATFKFIISPTPMVGPDDAYKSDNHVNPAGFRHEGDAFFAWLTENGFLDKNLYFICGDRHWQYHAVHPSGFEEFSTGALVDANSRAGRLAGDPKSTDPDTLIEQRYIQGTQEQASGGFLLVDVDSAGTVFTFFDERGERLYRTSKQPYAPK